LQLAIGQKWHSPPKPCMLRLCRSRSDCLVRDLQQMLHLYVSEDVLWGWYQSFVKATLLQVILLCYFQLFWHCFGAPWMSLLGMYLNKVDVCGLWGFWFWALNC
jgi:hypothetical protein